MTARRLRSGGLAAWAARHPIGVVMIALAVCVIGLFAFGRLPVDLLPQITYPTVRVRILDPGVSPTVMEDRVTRQVEEQLAITEDAIAVESGTDEGASRVDLQFQYGKDMDLALQDASTRLDRAKRFLPDTIDPPIIFKMDPAQMPVLEFVVSSPSRDPVALREWVDYVFSRWFINLPGVAAAEVGGGLVREIHVVPEPGRLAALGLTPLSLAEQLRENNVELPAGRLYAGAREYTGRTAGRFTTLEELREFPVPLPGGGNTHLANLATVADTHEDERLRVRLDGVPGIKVSIQKQPLANTVEVVEVVNARLDWLREQKLIPDDVAVTAVGDQSVYIRHALASAAQAVIGGATLAMLMVYLFLGDLRRTLVVGTAIPISMLVTFVLMDAAGLSLNIMTLGGLAVGVGMVVDSTIVMIENIYRHQRHGARGLDAAVNAATEVNSAIVASTSTNLAAILPFLFVGGLVGLLFRELIFTISAAMVAAMIVALAVVPALGARVPVTAGGGRIRRGIDAFTAWLQHHYRRLLGAVLTRRSLQFGIVGALLAGLATSWPTFTGDQEFLPTLDDGRIQIDVITDPGVALDVMDADVKRLEGILHGQEEVQDVYSLVGGRVFGRTQRLTSNRATLSVQLKPLAERSVSSEQFIERMEELIDAAQFAGLKVRMRTGSIRGIRVGRGEDDISLRVSGPDLAVLNDIGTEAVRRLDGLPGLRNVTHSSEEVNHELAVRIDRERASALGLSADQVARTTRISLDGMVVTDFIVGDRSYDVRVLLPRADLDSVQRLDGLLIAPGNAERGPVYLSDFARVELVNTPAEIRRDNQQRMIEISASLAKGATPNAVMPHVQAALADLPLPQGYSMYEAGITEALQEGQQLTLLLLGLAVFLVFVVMAVQYESLRNPVVILLGIPFAGTGVALGLWLLDMPLSMPVWLGMIMLAGIVVNNAIVLIEYIEIMREKGHLARDAIAEAASLRLRPVLMTTLTTVAGLMPLALGLGEGAELLRPLAVSIVFGLAFSALVTLLLIPVLYLWFAGVRDTGRQTAAEFANAP